MSTEAELYSPTARDEITHQVSIEGIAGLSIGLSSGSKKVVLRLLEVVVRSLELSEQTMLVVVGGWECSMLRGGLRTRGRRRDRSWRRGVFL